MDQKEKEQRNNEEKKSQSRCCDFSSNETQEMFKMMGDFCNGSNMNSNDCLKMMKEMMKNMSSKPDDSICEDVRSNFQKQSNNSETNIETGCC